MSESRPSNRFLDALVDDLEPTRPAASWPQATGSWLAIASLTAAFGVLATGPLRTGWVDDLRSFRFALEVVLGASTSFALIAAALEVGVPGAPAFRRLLGPGFLLLFAWLGLNVLNLVLGAGSTDPAHSMIGKREHCLVQGIAISLIPIAPAVAILRRRSLYFHWASGFLVGLAAASLTAVWMLGACMYDPGHALRSHFSPMLVSGLAGALLANRLLPKA